MKWFTYILCFGILVNFSNCYLFEDEYPTLKPIDYDLTNDTTVQKYLETMHGVWIKKGYLNTLSHNKSLYITNKVYDDGFVMFHIDKRQFHKYYLPFIAKTTQDTVLKKSFLYFERRKDGVMISLVTNHPAYTKNKTSFVVYPSMGATDFELVIKSMNERLKLLEDRYEKLTTILPPGNDINRPFVAVESYIQKSLISGKYWVLNTDLEVVESNFELTPTGNLGIEHNKVLTRYTFWSTATTDYLRFNLIGQDASSFFGSKEYVVQINQNDLTLYESVKIPNKKKEYRLEKRWILKRKPAESPNIK